MWNTSGPSPLGIYSQEYLLARGPDSGLVLGFYLVHATSPGYNMKKACIVSSSGSIHTSSFELLVLCSAVSSAVGIRTL
jgi:hypothetical protein